MPNQYFRNTGSATWGLASNWSLTDGGGATGSIPLASEDAFFTSNSGSCTITGTRVAKSLNFTGFTNNFNLNATTLTISGNITLGAGMTMSYTAGTLAINAAATLTANGVVMSIPLSITTAGLTISVADAWSFSRSLTLNGTLASPILLVSTSPSTQRVFTILQGASQDIDFVNATDMDSSAGLTVWNYKGSITNCVNWKAMPLRGVPTSYVF